MKQISIFMMILGYVGSINKHDIAKSSVSIGENSSEKYQKMVELIHY